VVVGLDPQEMPPVSTAAAVSLGLTAVANLAARTVLAAGRELTLAAGAAVVAAGFWVPAGTLFSEGSAAGYSPVC
jgi:hypothetical protein